MAERIIQVDGVDVHIRQVGSDDYISLTDMTSAQPEGAKLIEKWLSNKNTIEFLGIWEQFHNPDFNLPEFGEVKNDAGTNRFYMSPKRWIETVRAKGIVSKSGRYGGGTYAHLDIATEFGAWISPQFKLLLIMEFRRLKEEESQRLGGTWDLKRQLAKTNYRIHTDAIKEHIIPALHLTKDKEGFVYADEADIFNRIVFGMTAKEWRQQNPEFHGKGLNIRDTGDTTQLTVISALESINSYLISQGMSQQERVEKLRVEAIRISKSIQNSIDKLDALIKSPLIPPKTNQIQPTLPELDDTLLG